MTLVGILSIDHIFILKIGLDQLRLMCGVFSNATNINPVFMRIDILLHKPTLHACSCSNWEYKRPIKHFICDKCSFYVHVYLHLFHAIENSANQNSGKTVFNSTFPSYVAYLIPGQISHCILKACVYTEKIQVTHGTFHGIGTTQTHN